MGFDKIRTSAGAKHRKVCSDRRRKLKREQIKRVRLKEPREIKERKIQTNWTVLESDEVPGGEEEVRGKCEKKKRTGSLKDDGTQNVQELPAQNHVKRVCNVLLLCFSYMIFKVCLIHPDIDQYRYRPIITAVVSVSYRVLSCST